MNCNRTSHQVEQLVYLPGGRLLTHTRLFYLKWEVILNRVANIMIWFVSSFATYRWHVINITWIIYNSLKLNTVKHCFSSMFLSCYGTLPNSFECIFKCNTSSYLWVTNEFWLGKGLWFNNLNIIANS